jgi:hypothetical protein
MTALSLKFTVKELDLLSSLAADQLFRREFIDSRLAGNKSSPDDLLLGKKLVERMRVTSDKAKGIRSIPHAV